MAFVCLIFFKQKAAYELRISDWSSDVCSSDLSMMYCTASGMLSRGVEPPESICKGSSTSMSSRANCGMERATVPRKMTIEVVANRCSAAPAKIGRASCRERVCQYVEISGVAVSLKNRKYHRGPNE